MQDVLVKLGDQRVRSVCQSMTYVCDQGPIF